MNQCEKIQACQESSELFQRLALEYDGSSCLKDEIYGAIDEVTLETGMIPKLYEHNEVSIYIEFHNAYVCTYFNTVLSKLGIAV